MGTPWKHAMVMEDDDVQEAIRYVVSGQGDLMKVYLQDRL
jgi:hypothetical protein